MSIRWEDLGVKPIALSDQAAGLEIAGNSRENGEKLFCEKVRKLIYL